MLLSRYKNQAANGQNKQQTDPKKFFHQFPTSAISLPTGHYDGEQKKMGSWKRGRVLY